MAASNSPEAMRECIGHQIVGVLIGALPPHRPEPGCRTFVLDDGTGFTFNHNGAFWRESAEDVARAINRKLSDLQEAQETHAAILAMAGALPAVGADQIESKEDE